VVIAPVVIPPVVVPDDALVLALDQGSHASRAVLYDSTGVAVAEAHQAVGTRREADDLVEQDPEELLNTLRTAATDACDSAALHGRPVVAAGLATQRSTALCWERSSGRALTAALSWQDRRNAAWLAGLQPQAALVRGITGLPLSPHYGASKLRWCLDHVPEVRRAAAAAELAAGPLSSFLVSRLAEGKPCLVDPANASRTLLYDPATLDWSDALLQLFGLERRDLPRCVPSRHAFGEVLLRERSIPLALCTGDQSAAAFAFGQPDPDTALVNLGTGAFVQRVAPDGAPPPQGLLRSVLYADAAGTLHAHEGTVNGAGSALEWLRERVALDVDRALAALPVDRGTAETPLFMNGVGGLGAPFWRADFPTGFVGAGDDFAQLAAVLESIAFLLCVNIAALQRSAPLARIRLGGGLARSDYLCRVLADASGLAVERHGVTEATARGVAFLAAGAPASWRMPPVESVFTPSGDAALAARYAEWQSEMATRGAVT
jgi:glycerol kinase